MPIRRCDDISYVLALNASATGNAVAIKGGEYALLLDASTNTGTVSLQMQSPSGAWVDVQLWGTYARTTLTSMLQAGLSLPAGLVRIAITGGSATNLNAYLVGAG